MNLLNEILSSQNGTIVRQLAGQFGLNDQQAQMAVNQMLPALARGVRNNTQTESGLQSLMSALQQGNHSRYINQPSSLADPATKIDGNAILGHIFGSKDVSRRVASRAEKETGIGSTVLKQMLPVLATAVMGTLSKQTQERGGMLESLMGNTAPASNQNSFLGKLSGFLDADKDGSMLDDVLGMLVQSR